MPRKARQKYSGAIYHVMSRSMSEILLFREDADKCYYLDLLKRYKVQYKCSIYAYCLMDNHLHIHIDPQGFDISTFMHSLNTAYVRYYNRKYQRHGALFQGRFESRILDSDRYNLAVSSYIHNNAKDIPGFKGREEYYKYSSYGIYVGLHKDRFGLIDKSFIMGLFSIKKGVEQFIKSYKDFVSHVRDSENVEDVKEKLDLKVEHEYISGRQVIARQLSSSKVLSLISSKFNMSNKHNLAVSSNRSLIRYRSICAYALRVLCGLNYRQICECLHNITISGCSRLCNLGFELLNNDSSEYSGLFEELVSSAA